MDQRNLVVVKWGTYYGPEYVINLYNAAKKHMDEDFTFHVFTDDSTLLPQRLGWVFHRLPDWKLKKENAWWYKMEMFNPASQLVGRNVYLDLDVVIVGDISPLWTHGKDRFTICQDFNRVFIPRFAGVNSSVMAWTTDTQRKMYEKFKAEFSSTLATHRGDQDYIGSYHSDPTFWPVKWVQSYKWEIWRGGIKNRTQNTYELEDQKSIIPADCKVIAFHGKPKPHEITEKILKKAWQGS